MLVDAHSVIAIISPLGIELEVETARPALDESRAPYGVVALKCKLPAAADRDLIDLRGEEELRLDLRLRQDFGATWSLADLTADIGGSMSALTALLAGNPLGSLTNRYYEPWNGSLVLPSVRRNFDLVVDERIFDDVAGTLELTAKTDEALLIADALISESALDPVSTSTKAIVNQVLARYAKTLSAESLDATVAEVDATVWQPAVSAWDYLDPMLEAASQRLWCDETGQFHLGIRQPTTDGAVVITPTNNMTGHRDRMSFDPDVWVDAVVITYRWTDEFDLNQVAYDVAGEEPARSVLPITRENTRFPGPGAAAGILSRAQGRGRVLDVDAVSDYSVTPGMAATITPPETEAQTGYISAVSWQFPDAEMEVATRGLVDTPETAWLFAPVGLSWSEVPPGMSWLEYTPGGV